MKPASILLRCGGLVLSACFALSPAFAATPGCNPVLLELDSAVTRLRGQPAPDAATSQRLRELVGKVRQACKPSEFGPGTTLVDAYDRLRDFDGMEQAYDAIVPASDNERQMLGFRRAKFYTDRGRKDKAARNLKMLEASAAPDWMKSTARIEFECTFARCGSQRDALVAMVAQFPTVPGLRARLGHALAERREWPEAAKAFDQVLAQDPEVLTSVTGPVAVATYCNTGQRDKARRVFDLFSGSHGRDVSIEPADLANMKAMIEETRAGEFTIAPDPPK